jgi:hypothetical protein
LIRGEDEKSEERSLDVVRDIADLGDCKRLGGGVNFGTFVMRDDDGAGVGNGGKRGLLGAVAISVGMSTNPDRL